MVDFHTHILPQMDDGSSSINESVNMICAMAEQGIEHIAATPHFYAWNENIDSFLERREKSFEMMKQALELSGKQINVHLGSEVHYYDGISRTADISRLIIEDTNVMLLEMPFRKWNDSMFREINAIQSNLGCQVMLAHIERYISFNDGNFLDKVLDAGVIIQSNAEFFTSWKSRHKALKMVKKNYIDVISSDCHNMSTRKPILSDAFEIIENKLGDYYKDTLMNNSYRLLKKDKLFER